MPRLRHSPGVTGAFTPSDSEHYAIDDGILDIDDADRAAELVAEYGRLSWADADASPGVDAPETDTYPDAGEAVDTYPTNDDGDPLCAGKADGQCNRTVDEPGGTCWQHDD